MRVPSGRSGGSTQQPQYRDAKKVLPTGVGTVASGVQGISRSQGGNGRPRGAAEPRGGKNGTAGGGAAAGTPISSAPPGTGPAGPPPPLASRSFGGAITQAQLQASLSPTQGNYFSVASGPNRRRRSY